MSKLIKIQKPKFIDELEEIEDIYEEIIMADKIQNKIIENVTIEGKKDIGISMDSCIFKNVIFKDCSFKNIDLLDTIFENCDLSNVSFSNGSIHRVEFINCKILGTTFDESNFKDVLLQKLLGKYANFSYARFKSVNIVDCNFQDVIFQQARVEKIALKDSDLTNTYFNKTSLNKIDLTTCDITGIDLEIDDIAGATVTAMQGLELTRLMRITIK